MLFEGFESYSAAVIEAELPGLIQEEQWAGP